MTPTDRDYLSCLRADYLYLQALSIRTGSPQDTRYADEALARLVDAERRLEITEPWAPTLANEQARRRWLERRGLV